MLILIVKGGAGKMIDHTTMTQESDFEERREYTRIETEIRSKVRFPNGETCTGITRDLSLGGAYVECDPAVNDPLRGISQQAECKLYLSLEPNGTTVLLGKVIEISESRLGFRFTGATPDDYRRLRNYLLSNVKKVENVLLDLSVTPNPAFTTPWQCSDWWQRLLGHR